MLVNTSHNSHTRFRAMHLPPTLLRAVAAVLYVAILVVSALPGEDLAGLTEPLAIVGHAGAYATLAALLRLSTGAGGGLWVVSIIAIAAVLNEAEQAVVPGRAADVFDVGVDLLGGLLGVAAAGALQRGGN